MTEDIAATSAGAQDFQLSHATASPVQSKEIGIDAFSRFTMLNSPPGILDSSVPGLTMTSGPSTTLYEANIVVPSHRASQPEGGNLRVALPVCPAGTRIAERSERSLFEPLGDQPLALRDLNLRLSALDRHEQDIIVQISSGHHDRGTYSPELLVLQ